MKNIVIDFNEKISNEISPQNTDDYLRGELQFLILDCCDITRALFIYKRLTSEEYFGNILLFSPYYNTITDALVTQIVISLSRLFDNHKDAVSLLKTLNRIKQHTTFRNNSKIKTAIDELIRIDAEAKGNFDFKGPRDQCFAHLDKRQIFSRTRIVKCIGNTDELIVLMESVISQLASLYELCYKMTPVTYGNNIEIPDIRQISGFKERAEKMIAQNSVYKNHLELTDAGIKYYPLGIKK